MNTHNIQGIPKTLRDKNKYAELEWVDDMNTRFSKEEIQMTNQYSKTCLLSPAIKEAQIQTPVSSISPAGWPLSKDGR